jgi:hypothetical protein
MLGDIEICQPVLAAPHKGGGIECPDYPVNNADFAGAEY